MPKMKKCWNLAKAQTKNSADLVLYGSIGTDEYWDDVTDKQFRQDVMDLGDVDEIHVYVNSPGGDVFAAIAIGNVLKNHNAKVTAHIDGLAASAATIITSSCDSVIMPKNALFMIHNPWTITWGDRNDLEKTIEELDKAKNSILETYLMKSSMEKETLSKLMDDESWLTAEEAENYGFIDEIAGEIKNSAKAFQRNLIVNGLVFDMSGFKNMPKNIENLVKMEDSPKRIESKQNETVSLNIDIIEKDFNDIYQEILNKGILEERKRIQEIENLEISGLEDMVKNAKFEAVMSASELAIKAVKELKNSNVKVLENLKNESFDNRVGAIPTKVSENNGFLNSMLKFMNKKTQEVK